VKSCFPDPAFTVVPVLSIVVTSSSFYGVFPYRRAVFPCSQVVLPQFCLPRRDSTPQIRVWGSFWFLLLFLRCIVTVFLYNHWRFPVRDVPLLVLVFLPLQFPVVVLVIFTTATYPTTSLRRLALRALSFASFSPTLSLHHILADPFSEHGVTLLNTEEGRVNG
jgi:hypothetical protein